MSLINIKIFGFNIDDYLTAKIIIGTVGVFILLLIYGFEGLINWVHRSLIIWTAAFMIVASLSYGFVEENFTFKHIIMILIGLLILGTYMFLSSLTPIEILTSVTQSIVWMTIFSIILSQLRRLE